MMQRSCSDENVWVADELAVLAKTSANAREMLHDAPVERKHGGDAEKLPKGAFIRRRVVTVIDAVQ